MKEILITGGAGYIGSNLTLLLAQKKFKVIVVDNFSNSFSYHIKSLAEKFVGQIEIFDFDILDKEKLSNLFKTHNIEIVVHLAGKKYIPDSFIQEQDYFLNNVTATKLLLDVMTQYKVKKIVFSSSMTVYGQKKSPIKENSSLTPKNPYAEQKVLAEKMIEHWTRKKENQAIILRLANPLGANEKYLLGDHSTLGKRGVLNFILNALKNNENFKISGGNDTKDGTTIRNYIHILDVASAFYSAIEYFENDFHYIKINIGGQDYISVLDLVHQAESQTGKTALFGFKGKVDGDVPVLVNDISKAKTILNFNPKLSAKEMVKSANKFFDFIS